VEGFVDVPGGRLELLDLDGNRDVPPLVLLHEGLGSIGLWRRFPRDVHRRTGARTVAFSRFGHGRSDAPPRPRTPAFMHEEAREVLPALVEALGIECPVLVGHSDGASIALVYAAEHDVSGLVLLAPHVFVEDVCIDEIRSVRDAYESELRPRMARHHADPDVTFRGWCDVWLDPEFRRWTLEPLLADVTAPMLLIQGREDPYGTLAQIEATARGVTGRVETLVVDGGHSPHLDHPELVLDALTRFFRRLGLAAPDHTVAP
jgi:pimeloyl-ACP methyl ester carboxylesterase